MFLEQLDEVGLCRVLIVLVPCFENLSMLQEHNFFFYSALFTICSLTCRTIRKSVVEIWRNQRYHPAMILLYNSFSWLIFANCFFLLLLFVASQLATVCLVFFLHLTTYLLSLCDYFVFIVLDALTTERW